MITTVQNIILVNVNVEVTKETSSEMIEKPDSRYLIGNATYSVLMKRKSKTSTKCSVCCNDSISVCSIKVSRFIVSVEVLAVNPAERSDLSIARTDGRPRSLYTGR